MVKYSQATTICSSDYIISYGHLVFAVASQGGDSGKMAAIDSS